MRNITYLTDLHAGEHARIVSVQSEGGIRRRLLDLGLTPHAEVTCVGHSPSGDPSAYLIRGAIIAIRDTDGHKIIIDQQVSEVSQWG